MRKLIFLVFLIFFSTSVSALSISNVEVVPSRVSPGNSANIRLQIENEENFDVNDILVKLNLDGEDLPIAPTNSGIEKFILEIEEEDKEYVYFDVVVLSFAPLGVYKIPVTIIYEKDGEIVTKNDMVSLEVYSNPNLEVRISDPDFLFGEIIDLEFEVINKGLSDVTFLTFNLEDSEFYNIISDSSSYVGDVDSDDFERVDFKIMLDYPIPDQISFPIYLTYSDSLNQEHLSEFTVRKKVYSSDFIEAMGLLNNEKGFNFIFILPFILLLFLYHKFRRKKRLLI